MEAIFPYILGTQTDMYVGVSWGTCFDWMRYFTFSKQPINFLFHGIQRDFSLVSHLGMIEMIDDINMM